MYQIKSSWWLRKFYPGKLIWRIPEGEKPTVYLSFDDGPHPEITPWVLQHLHQFNARASFFCIGKNVAAYPEVYQSILDAGHITGNHTYNHLNGWEVGTEEYLDNIRQASELIENRIFRPPYGRISRTQAQMLSEAKPAWKIYMWDVLSADFDQKLQPERCLENLTRHTQPGSIVVFHDSEKAWKRLEYALPRFLEFCSERQWAMETLPL